MEIGQKVFNILKLFKKIKLLLNYIDHFIIDRNYKYYYELKFSFLKQITKTY